MTEPNAPQNAATPNPPNAPRRPVTRTHHGREFVDNYEWLREKSSAETLSYLREENAFTEAKTAHLKQLQDNIFNEVKSRTQETDLSVPQRAGKYWYYGRTLEGKSYGLSCRVPVSEGADAWRPPKITTDTKPEDEQVLLDLNELAEGHEFFSLGVSSVTTSGRYLAYSTDTRGDERFDLVIKDLETGELLPDRIEGISYGACWVGEDYLFYQRVDEAWRPDSVWRHKVGTPSEEDVRVFHEPDEKFWVGVGGTRSERYLLIDVGSKLTSETWVLDQDNPTGEFRCVLPRREGVEYSLDHLVIGGSDRWLVTHNATGPNFALAEVPVDPEDPASLEQTGDLTAARELIAHRDDVRLEGVDAYAGQVVAAYRSGAIGRIAVMRLEEGAGDYGEFKELEFDEEIYTVGSLGNPEWDAPVIRMSYGSFTTPTQIFDYWVATGERVLLKEQEVLGEFNREDYQADRLWVTARDGARVPVSLVHRRDVDVDQQNPTVLYGYGSYEASTDPGFSITRLSMLDRGMVFAIAHVRGGGEMGRLWYDNGKQLTKKNTFTDFIDVAQALIEQGRTDADHLVALGGSAGGMLMGAIANMAPQTFHAIQAVVPFVDPLTSMLMPELPLTVTEWEEWGDPLHDPAVYDYMASYAPYENVEAIEYPNIMAVTSLNDTRVLYVEPAKWIAELRHTAKGGEFLLKTEMVAGHGGVSGRYEKWKQNAFEYAWLINQATGLEA